MLHALDDAEVKRRFVRLANLERLYPELQEKYERLKEENAILKETVAAQARLIEQ